MKILGLIMLSIVLAVVSPIVAATTHEKGGQLAEGEVRKVDKDAKKITIRHGPIQSLDMPALTMVFLVKDLALLDKVKTGDKVRFVAEKTGGADTVTHVESAK